MFPSSHRAACRHPPGTVRPACSRYQSPQGGAAALLVVLMAGQIILPAKTYTSQDARLEESMTLAGTKASAPNDRGDSSSAESHVAMRLPSDSDSNVVDSDAGREEQEPPVSIDELFPSEPKDSADSSPGDAQPDADLPANGDNGPARPINSSQQRIVEFLNGSLKLDVYKHALIGSPEAPHVMIEMVSYDCPHCREMHRTIEARPVAIRQPSGDHRHADPLGNALQPTHHRSQGLAPGRVFNSPHGAGRRGNSAASVRAVSTTG